MNAVHVRSLLGARLSQRERESLTSSDGAAGSRPSRVRPQCSSTGHETDAKNTPDLKPAAPKTTTADIYPLVRIRVKKGKCSPHSITERRVPELIPVLGSQPAGDVSHKPGGRLPLLSARPAVTPSTL